MVPRVSKFVLGNRVPIFLSTKAKLTSRRVVVHPPPLRRRHVKCVCAAHTRVYRKHHPGGSR
jgi:hypothetical protein